MTETPNTFTAESVSVPIWLDMIYLYQDICQSIQNYKI